MHILVTCNEVLVIGIGRMGYAVLRDLMESDEVTEIVAADLHFERLRRWVDRLRETDERAEKMEPIRIDSTDRDQLTDVLKRGFDVVSDCLLWTYTPLHACAGVCWGGNSGGSVCTTNFIYIFLLIPNSSLCFFLASPSVEEEPRRTLSGRARVRKRLSVFGCRLGSGACASNGTLLFHRPATCETHVFYAKLSFRSTFLFFALSLFINCLSYPLRRILNTFQIFQLIYA